MITSQRRMVIVCYGFDIDVEFSQTTAVRHNPASRTHKGRNPHGHQEIKQGMVPALLTMGAMRFRAHRTTPR